MRNRPSRPQAETETAASGAQEPGRQGRLPAPGGGAGQGGKAGARPGIEPPAAGKAEKKAKAAQIKQLIEGTRLPKLESDDYYNFVDAKKVKRIAVNDLIRDKLSRGSLAIVSYDGRYEIVPRDAAVKIQERDPRRVVLLNVQSRGAGRRRSLQGLCGARRSHVVRPASGVSLDRYGCRSTTNSGMRSSSKITTDDFVSIA